MSDPMVLIDAAGRRRSPATLPGYLLGRAPRNKGMEYPADPPRPEEIILVMRQAGQDRHGLRIRALVAVLWRGGLRISEALALNETDVDARRGSLVIRQGKGDKRRQAGMDQFGFEQLAAWLAHRVALPPGPLFCVIDGVTRGRRWAATSARAELRQLAAEAGVRRRFAPHQLRHAHAVELAREGVAVSRQSGISSPTGKWSSSSRKHPCVTRKGPVPDGREAQRAASRSVGPGRGC
jgi:integrase